MNFPEMYGENGGDSRQPRAAEAEEVILVIDDDDEECFSTAASTPPPRWLGRTTAAEDEEEDDGVAEDWCLSPASRALEIARGQRELMEMIRTMPEDFYELSLKDLVDHHAQFCRKSDPDRVEEPLPERNSSSLPAAQPVKKADNNPPAAKMKRSGSVNYGSGFLLRLPINYLRSRNKNKKMVKKKKKVGVMVDGGSGRVSPKPAVEAGESKRSSSAFSGGGSESRSSKGSTSRGSWRSSSRNNSIRRKNGGRWCLFFSSSKGKVVE